MITGRKSLHFLGTLTLLLALVNLATAQITITFTATANSTAAGYTAGSSYTFVFVSASSYPWTSDSNFFSSSNEWTTENSTTQPNPWAEISGTGLTGTFAIPSGFDAYAGARVTSDFDGMLKTYAASDNSDISIGLKTPDNTDIGWIETAAFEGNLPAWTFSESYVEPFNATTGYFAVENFFGTYTPSNSSWISIYGTDGSFDTIAEFTVTSVSIGATSAIPEPSTYAGLAGLAALGLVVWRRLHQKA
jgi:hypothetical protein